ncbi:hypothetical protein QQ045_021277 [Rhodiola kirilowii]
MSLSCAVNCCHCGGIVRDEKGTFIFGFYIALELDDFVEGIITAMLLLKEVGLSIRCIQSSHYLCKHLNSNAYGGGDTDYCRWREVRSLLVGVISNHITVEMNNAAIAMSYLGGSSNIFHDLRILPRPVRVAITGDYMKLPTWCRTQTTRKRAKEYPRAPRSGSPDRQQAPRTSQTDLCPYI